MKQIYLQSLKDLLQPKILLIVLIPWIISVIIWILLTIASLDFFIGIFAHPQQYFAESPFFSSDIFWVTLLKDLIIASVGAITALFVGFSLFSIWPILFTFMTGILSPFVTPLIMRQIAKQYEPHGENRGQHHWYYFFSKGLYYLIVYLMFCIFTSPLFLIPGIGSIWGIILNSVYLTKVFSLDTIDDYSDKNEIQEIKNSTYVKSLWGMGFIHSLLLTLPFYAIIAPAFISLTFGHWTFYHLKIIRSRVQPD